jgi:type IV secretion system protein VirB1
MIPHALFACAPNVSPVTLEAVVSVESAGNPLALYINGLHKQPLPARDAREAAQMAGRFIALGYSVDLGLMQVNSSNLGALGVTIEQALDPCGNIRAGAAILTADYAEATRIHGEGQNALQAALSAYNTGDFHRGFQNGYVARYYGPNGVPALAGGAREAAAFVSTQHKIVATAVNPYTAGTSVFAREPVNVGIE